jgi:hypothetical protein
LKAQVKEGLNMGLSGIPWWTSDIGGFRGGDPTSPYFQQLIVRWFQFGAFCPIFRLHGHRLPNINDFNGAANEVWSFGEPAYQIIKKYMLLRERLRPYVMKQMSLRLISIHPCVRFCRFSIRPVFRWKMNICLDQTCWWRRFWMLISNEYYVYQLTVLEGCVDRSDIRAGNGFCKRLWIKSTVLVGFKSSN